MVVEICKVTQASTDITICIDRVGEGHVLGGLGNELGPPHHELQLLLQQQDGVIHVGILCHLPVVEDLQLLDDHLPPLLVVHLHGHHLAGWCQVCG